MKVKLFMNTGKYFKKPNLSNELENEINQWLEVNKQIEIKEIKQACCGGSLEPALTVISIWYDDKKN
ncbi:MAG: hypothetical protein K8F60_13935 [Melioribacteraceae bacterium]|jgi:hypothetical protein|nr:hypothetical protein [Ignavibacteriota bacterium]MBZ0183553.1 hypothetical protein [Melioribacteraceae bacterium]